MKLNLCLFITYLYNQRYTNMSKIPANVLALIDDYEANSLTFLSNKTPRETMQLKQTLVYWSKQTLRISPEEKEKVQGLLSAINERQNFEHQQQSQATRFAFVKDIKFSAEKYLNILSRGSGVITTIILAIIRAPNWYTQTVSSNYTWLLWLFTCLIAGGIVGTIIYVVIWWFCCHRKIEKIIIEQIKEDERALTA